jgi:hypothetical protein
MNFCWAKVGARFMHIIIWRIAHPKVETIEME